jgi:hypothetical protein
VIGTQFARQIPIALFSIVLPLGLPHRLGKFTHLANRIFNKSSPHFYCGLQQVRNFSDDLPKPRLPIFPQGVKFRSENVRRCLCRSRQSGGHLPDHWLKICGIHCPFFTDIGF